MERDRILVAAQEGDVQVLRTLRGGVLSAKDSFGASALHHAARNGQLECVKWLVDILGMTGLEKAKNGASPLHDAASAGQLDCVEYLIKHAKVPADHTDHSGHTALHLAVRFGSFDTVKWLLTKGGSNARCKTRNRMNAIHFAVAGDSLACLKLLLSNTSFSSINDSAVDGTTPIYIAAQNGSFGCLKYLKHNGGKCNIKSRDGMLPIHAAAQNGHLDCLGLLVEDGVSSVEARGPSGATPAHYAAAQGQLSVLKWLNVKADITLNDDHRGSPLHDAAEHGHFECIQFLVECCGLDMTQKDNNGLNPTELAEMRGHRKCSDLLKIAAAKRAKAEKRLVGGLRSVSTDQLARNIVSQKSDCEVAIPRNVNLVSQLRPTAGSVQGNEQFVGGQNSKKCRKTNPASPVISRPGEMHNEKSSSFQIGKQTPKAADFQKQLSPKVTEPHLTTHLTTLSEVNGNAQDIASAENPFEKSPKTFTYNASYSEWITKPPPTETLPLPDVTSTLIHNGVSTNDTRKVGYHLPLLKTLPSYNPVYFKHEWATVVDNVVSKLSNDLQTTRSKDDVLHEDALVGATRKDILNGGIKEDYLNGVITDFANNVSLKKLHTSDRVDMEDSFQVKKLVDEDLTDLSSTHGSEMLYALNENYLPNFQDSFPARCSSEHQKSAVELLEHEFCEVTVPPPVQFVNGDSETSKASDQNSLLKTENESVPQWKQQIYLNKLQKKKKNEEMQRKSEEQELNKWEGVPRWKIPKLQQQEEQRMKRINKLESLPEWKRNLLLRRENVD